MVEIKMLDGSTFVFPNKHWEKAFKIKYGEDEKGAVAEFKRVTKRHFDDRTVPTKFGSDDKWERNYADHAELGMDVMYVYIRAALFAIIAGEMSKIINTKGELKVVGIGDDGKVREYTSEGKKELRREDY